MIKVYFAVVLTFFKIKVLIYQKFYNRELERFSNYRTLQLVTKNNVFILCH